MPALVQEEREEHEPPNPHESLDSECAPGLVNMDSDSDDEDKIGESANKSTSRATSVSHTLLCEGSVPEQRVLHDGETPIAKLSKKTRKQLEATVKKAAKKKRLPGANHAMVDGVWQTDGSSHTLDGSLSKRDVSKGTAVLAAKDGCPTLRVAYFFSGVERKSSISNYLREYCQKEGFGLEMHEVDTLVGGENHNLKKKEVQDDWIDRIERGDFDVVIHSPPCGSWSRSNWANDAGPQPCRDRKHPWGLPS